MYRIPLIRPRITDDVKRRVLEVLDSGYWTEGETTHELERSFESYIGCRHALAVTSCTTGLEVALRALGVGPDDEVIVPDYTYPATASVVRIVGAKIVIVDVERSTMLIDYDAMEQAVTPATKAIIPVSLFGNPLDFDRLREIKKRTGVFVVEDAACSIGASRRGVRVGDSADITVFSLHPRKFISTGEGGIVTTNNSEWAEWMRSYKYFGMGIESGRPTGEFVRIGTNYKLSNILAAVGLSQMQEIDALLDRRIELADGYLKRLSARDAIAFQETTPEGSHSRQSFCVRVQGRDRVMEAMRSSGIEVQIGTFALHRQRGFRESEGCAHRGPFPESAACYEQALVLPLFHEMSSDDQDGVASELLKLLPPGRV